MITRGIDVLYAATQGKRIRPADARWAFPGSRWLTLDEKRRWFWDEIVRNIRGERCFERAIFSKNNYSSGQKF